MRETRGLCIDESNRCLSVPLLQVSARRAVEKSRSLCSQHGGWTRHSPVDSPSKETNFTPESIFYWSPNNQLTWKISNNLLIFWKLSWVCIPGTHWVNHPGTSPTRTPSLPVEVAPSILQNALRLASRLLQLLHFTCWLVGLSTPSHALFWIHHLSISPLLWRARQMQLIRAKAHSDVTVWLSRTWGQELWVCCNVVAITHSGSNLTTKYVIFILPDKGKATCNHYKTPLFNNDRFSILTFCFDF